MRLREIDIVWAFSAPLLDYFVGSLLFAGKSVPPRCRHFYYFGWLQLGVLFTKIPHVRITEVVVDASRFLWLIFALFILGFRRLFLAEKFLFIRVIDASRLVLHSEVALLTTLSQLFLVA